MNDDENVNGEDYRKIFKGKVFRNNKSKQIILDKELCVINNINYGDTLFLLLKEVIKNTKYQKKDGKK